MTGSGPWRLDLFEPMLDAWVERDRPDATAVRTVALWMAARADDPFAGCRRDGRLDGLWFAEVRGTMRGSGPTATVVVCSFLVYEPERRLQCASLATLSWPVG